MSQLPFLLAWRSIFGAQHEKSISIMTKICFLSIFIGSFSLALVMAIMNGFEKVTHEKMQGIHAQIIMRAYGQELDLAAIEPVLKTIRDIQAYSPTSFGHVIIQKPASDDISNLIMLKAIDPVRESKITTFNKKIINPRNTSLETLLENNQILIGTGLAQNLDLSVGDPVTLLYAPDTSSGGRRITFENVPATISGIFKTGIDEFDASLALSSLLFHAKLFERQGITQLNIKLNEGVDENNIIKNLKKTFNGLEIYSWKELYPALVSALKLEKYAMFLVLALITLVASMNIIALLYMQITQKKPTIAILKALGMLDNDIRNIFLSIGLGIAFIASILGLACAWLASWFLEQYPLITLPDVYYVTHLPARMELHILIIVFITIMIISFLSTWIPCQSTKKINISQVLRYEA